MFCDHDKRVRWFAELSRWRGGRFRLQNILQTKKERHHEREDDNHDSADLTSSLFRHRRSSCSCCFSCLLIFLIAFIRIVVIAASASTSISCCQLPQCKPNEITNLITKRSRQDGTQDQDKTLHVFIDCEHCTVEHLLLVAKRYLLPALLPLLI